MYITVRKTFSSLAILVIFPFSPTSVPSIHGKICCVFFPLLLFGTLTDLRPFLSLLFTPTAG
jgi:hypothetical protein